MVFETYGSEELHEPCAIVGIECEQAFVSRLYFRGADSGWLGLFVRLGLLVMLLVRGADSGWPIHVSS